MVICIVALVVFGVLGIFSATHRKMFFEALHCLKRNITLRPCETGFDRKIKYAIARRVYKFPKLHSFVYRNFNIFSWMLVILLFGSMAYSAYGVYNLVTYKTCDPQNPSSCPLSGIAGYNKTLNITQKQCETNLKSEVKIDKCATPPGYTDESWQQHMSHHPDRYKECLEQQDKKQ